MDDTELKELLQEHAERVQVEPDMRIPGPVLRRARRRRVLTGVVAGLTAAVVVAGAVVGIQAAFREQPTQVPVHHGTPPPSPAIGSFPGIWPVATHDEVAQLEAKARAHPDLSDPEKVARDFAVSVLRWRSERIGIRGVAGTGDQAHVILWDRDMGIYSPQIAETVDLQRFSNEAGSAVWVVTGSASGLMDVRCPSPLRDAIGGSKVRICGHFTQPSAGWSLMVTIDPATSGLGVGTGNASEISIVHRGFHGYAEVRQSAGDVVLMIRLTSGSGASLALYARRFKVGVSGPAPTESPGTSAALPAAVERTRQAILSAADAHNYSKLEPLIDPKAFQYTFGQPATSAIAYWKQQGFRPLSIMGALLKMPYALEREGSIKLYVWPSAYLMRRNQLARLSPTLRQEFTAIYPNLTQEMKRWAGAGAYTGWRLGIDSRGRWVFFLTND
jgi:hypothetical protein